MSTRVLVVEDEKDILDLVRYHLEKEGFQCFQAADGPGALRLVHKHRPDLLIESEPGKRTTVRVTLPTAGER